MHHCRNRGKAFGRAAGGIPDFWKIVGLEAEGFKIDSSTGLRQGKEIVWVQWQGSQKRIVQPPTIFETKPEYPRTCPP